MKRFGLKLRFMHFIKGLLPIWLVCSTAGLLIPALAISQPANSSGLAGSQSSVTVTPATNSILPKTLSPQDLIKLEIPPQVAIPLSLIHI